MNRSIEHFDQQYVVKGANSQRRYPNEAVIRFLAANYFSLPSEQRKITRILDLGCGSGSNLMVVNEEGFDSHGIDGSLTGLTLAKQAMSRIEKCETNETRLTNGNFSFLPYRTNTFDAVIDVVSLHHLNSNDLSIALKEIYRVLKTGGSRFFSFRLSQGSSIFKDLKQSGVWLDEVTLENIPSGFPLANSGPVSFWSVDNAIQEFTENGFGSVRISKSSRTYEDNQFVEYLEISAIKD
jgi:ubiquinone/menaquinone biosynthesis C-methylase UbiE